MCSTMPSPSDIFMGKHICTFGLFVTRVALSSVATMLRQQGKLGQRIGTLWTTRAHITVLQMRHFGP